MQAFAAQNGQFAVGGKDKDLRVYSYELEKIFTAKNVLLHAYCRYL